MNIGILKIGTGIFKFELHIWDYQIWRMSVTVLSVLWIFGMELKVWNLKGLMVDVDSWTFKKRLILTRCGLVAPYGDIDLGQHWPR